MLELLGMLRPQLIAARHLSSRQRPHPLTCMGTVRPPIRLSAAVASGRDWMGNIVLAMSGGRSALRYLWLVTAPVTAFHGWQVSAMAVDPALERVGVALTVSVFPVSVVIALTQARHLGTLKDRIIMPWWCVAAFTVLVFPILYGALSYEYELSNGHGIVPAILLMVAWTAPHVIALSGLAVTGEAETVPSEPAAVEVPGDQTAQALPINAPAIPPGLTQYGPGMAPDNLRTDWQLGQDGLRPGGPARGWLLLDRGPGMYLYDVNEATPPRQH